MSQRKPYIIDTNILINFRIFTPMSVHVTFWKQFNEAVENGTIIIIREVADECKDSEINEWVKSQRIIETDDVQKRAIEIDDKYHLITQKEGITKSAADPVIIAYAEKNNGIVFTREAKRKLDDTPMKIPDVCEALSIKYQRWPDQFFKNIKFKTI